MKDNFQKIPKLCNKNYTQLFEEFKFLASQFTPEWRFDSNRTDFGVSLAKIFCEMQEDTINRLNQSMNNIYITFLKILGVSPLPRSPAQGLIEIKASENSICSNIKKGSKLSYGDLIFETVEDIFVSDNKVEKIFMVDSLKRQIVKTFDINLKNSSFKKFKFFDFKSFKNLQSSEIYFSDNYMFNSEDVLLKFKFENSFSPNSEDLMSDLFLNSKWQYFNEEDNSWKDFDEISKDDNLFVNVKLKNKIGLSEVLDDKSRYIKITIPERKNIKLTGISYISDPKKVIPTELLSGEDEIDKDEFFPFKERYYIYDCFYIKSDEIFNKPGAKVSLSADVSFIKSKGDLQNNNRHYKMIMTDIDFAESEPNDISIENVVWEYWKGNSWALLNSSNGNFFSTADIGKNRKMSFICPSDCSPTDVGSKSGLFIRARITKISNQFSINSNYLVPLIKNVELDYNYENPMKLERVIANSDLEWKTFNFANKEKKFVNIFEKEIDNFPSIYFKLKNPISQGILNIFFDVEKSLFKEKISFKWFYWSKEENNSSKWKPLDVIDFTDNFSKSGIVRILGSNSFAKLDLFGGSGFFIKIESIGKLKEYENFPVIKDIRFNVVPIIQKESKPYEYFSVNGNEKNKICSLSSSNIFDVAVWVDETSKIFFDEDEKIKMQNNNDIEIEDNSGAEKIWVKWKEISNISNAGPNDRVYEVNYEESQIIFGNGIRGKIPIEQSSESIRVNYSTTEGKKGNIDPGLIKSFNSVFPSVIGVSNFAPTYNGLDPEDLERASQRTFDEISRGKRIISSTSLENAILFNNRNVFKIKCFPHTNKYEEKSYGDITIVVLPRNIMKEQTKFEILKKELESFLDKNSFFGFSNKNITICEAKYVGFYINIIVFIKNMDHYQEVNNNIKTKIENFLNPITGGRNGEGFDIGKIPDEIEILGNINFIPGISRIEKINISTKISNDRGEKKEILFSDAKNLKFGVPIVKNIDIEIKI